MRRTGRVGRTRIQAVGVASAVALLALTSSALSATPTHHGPAPWHRSPGSSQLSGRSLDGGGNNVRHPDWGRAGVPYLRVAPPNYADRVGQMASGPGARYVSNRIFNDTGQNIFSENGVSQWGWAWGQFLDHDFGLRDETPAESAPIPFSSSDPLERFTNDFGAIGFSRTPAAPGTGGTTPRQQINTISSFIDASNVFGVSSSRLEWLRQGPVDGTLADNSANLLLPDGYLPLTTPAGTSLPRRRWT
jgi:Animal haem peroxidase